MKKITITQKDRRFLIVWVSVCAFALLSNLAPIRGKLYNGDYDEKKAAIFLFSSGSTNGFWPITTKFINDALFVNEEGNNAYAYGSLEPNGFRGIFNGFDYPEFFVYLLLGLAIVFIPKIW